MDQESAEHSQVKALNELAERQHGVIGAAQLYSLGLSETQVGTRVRNGWLHRLHRGVYAVGRRRLPHEGYWMAGILACGDCAVLSHQSASELWEIRRRTHHSPVEVTIRQSDGSRARAGIVVHRVPSMREDETTRVNGLPVTTPARTVLDLATRLPRRQLERAIDEADRLGLCTEKGLDEIGRTHLGRAGAGALRGVLREHLAGSTATRNEFEERFLALCRRYQLPQPEVNVQLLDYVVDFLWREVKLIVEVDGRATHGTRRAFQADRDRDGRLAVAGYRVLRFTWWDLTRRPAIVAERVRRLLGARRVSGDMDG